MTLDSIPCSTLVHPASALTVHPPRSLVEQLRSAVQRLPVRTDLQLADEAVQVELKKHFWASYQGWHDLAASIDDGFNKRGVVLVRGLPFDTGNQLLTGLIATIARIANDGNPGRRTIFDVVPVARPPGQVDFELAFHTGSYFRQRPHELLALQCVRPAAVGGESRLLDIDSVLEVLRARGESYAIDLLCTDPVMFKRTRETGVDYIESLLLTPPTATYRYHAVRYERRRLRHGQSGREGGYSDALIDAILMFESALDAASSMELALQADDLLILDNRRVMHARTAVHDAFPSKRHLKRIKAYRP